MLMDLVGNYHDGQLGNTGEKAFLWIDVDHPSAGRSRAEAVTMADTAFGIIFRIVFPLHFGTYKFHGRNLAF